MVNHSKDFTKIYVSRLQIAAGLFNARISLKSIALRGIASFRSNLVCQFPSFFDQNQNYCFQKRCLTLPQRNHIFQGNTAKDISLELHLTELMRFNGRHLMLQSSLAFWKHLQFFETCQIGNTTLRAGQTQWLRQEQRLFVDNFFLQLFSFTGIGRGIN